MFSLGRFSIPNINYGRSVPADRWDTENSQQSVPHGNPSVITTDDHGVLWTRGLAVDPNSGDVLPATSVDIRREYSTSGSEQSPAPVVGAFGYSFNGLDGNGGETWERNRNISVTNDQATEGILQTGLAQQWAEFSSPVANAQPIATRAAAGAGIANICNTIQAAIVGPVASIGGLNLELVDGATVIWSSRIYLPPGGGTVEIHQSGLSLTGTVDTAMILRISAAPGDAALFASTAMTGHVGGN